MLQQIPFIFIWLLTIISLISCEGGSSLTFVIDESESMKDDIDQVRNGAKGIMDTVLKHKSSQIKDIVLVTFNDPIRLTKLREKTRDPAKLQAALNAIIVAPNYENNDWPEYSMSGIELALQESQLGSYLYVFTDASAKDHYNANIVKDLCQRKQTQIIFVLTDYCISDSDIQCLIYHEVAEACSGQVFILDKNEIYKVIEYVKQTVSGEKNIITTRQIPPHKKTAIQFTIDDKTEYVLISVSGDNAIISDKKGPSSDYETVMSTSNVKILKLNYPKPGSYEVTVYGESKVSVIIFGRTDFLFEHGFSEMTPKSVKDASKQPISGSKSYLSISVTDPDHEVNIKSAQILNMKEEVIYNLPLKKAANDFYITDQFVAPNSMFKVAVIGTVIKTGRDIRRVAKTPVEPQKPKIKPIEKKAPVSTISEGPKINIAYDSSLQLTCTVTGYPQPTIIWKDDKGTVLPSKSYPVELPYKYINYLALSHIKKSGKYHCYGNNELDKTHSSIDVAVLPALTVDTSSKGPLNVNYGKEVVIKCKIQSSFPKRINWFRILNNKHEQVISSNIYTISSDGSELKIKFMDINLQGKYMCKATLVADESETAIFDTEVKIDDLATPEIQNSNPSLTVKEKTRTLIPCRITKGNPKPKITWVFQSKGSDRSQPISGSAELLEIVSSTLSDAGTYTCTAENALGKAKQITELIVEAPPTIITKDKKNIYTATDGDKVLSIPCKAVGYPKPVISWKLKGVSIMSDLKYEIQQDGTLAIKTPTEKDTSDEYVCNASNKLGTVSDKFNVDVTSKPEIQNSSPTLTVKEKTRTLIPCRITKGNPKPKITWVFQSKGSDKSQPISGSAELLEIVSSTLSDAGTYTCTAENALGKAKQITELIVEAPPTIITKDKKNIYTATDGDKVLSIPCKAVGYPKPVISWKLKGVSIMSDLKYEIQQDGTLVIKTPTEKDTSNEYVCNASNKLGTVSDKFNVDVTSKPEIQNSSPTLTVKEKTRTLIPCRITKGNPKPKITWIFQSKGSDRSQPISGSAELLEIVSSTLSDAGTYTCTAENALGKAKQITELIVEAPPTIITKDKKEIYAAIVGDNVLSVPCNAVGFPKPVISWKLKGRSIMSDLKYEIQQDGTLVIKTPTEKDTSDDYICNASNKLGTASEKYNVDVTTYLIHDDHFGNSSKIYILSGKSKQVECGLSHTKDDTVKWFMNGQEINNTKTFMDFKNATQEYDGNYTCRVSNSHGSNSETYEVDVGYPPRFKLELVSTNIDWKGDRDDIANCDVISKPAPMVKWTYNGKDVEGASDTELKIFSWGDYSCEISNPHGIIQRSFKISSKDCLIDRNINAAQNMPLMLTGSPKWRDLEIQKEFLVVKSGLSLKLSCITQPSKTNYFARISSKSEVTATCDHNDNYLVDGKAYQLSNLNCKSEVMPAVVRTGTKCLDENTELIKVGFNVDSFVKVYEVCYDSINKLPLYASSEMSDINNFANMPEHNWYNYPGLDDINSGRKYTCQKKSDSCCYSKSQLVSAQDVHYGPAQNSAFIDHLNAIPLWQPCEKNRVTWDSLEDIVRSKYDEHTEFSVWSGTSKPVTVNGGIIPRYLWKVMQFDPSEAMAMVYVNDPAPTASDILCKNVCADDAPWARTSDKYTYCCRLEDFKKAFNFTANIFE